jgi:hypothetical protein
MVPSSERPELRWGSALEGFHRCEAGCGQRREYPGEHPDRHREADPEQ